MGSPSSIDRSEIEDSLFADDMHVVDLRGVHPHQPAAQVLDLNEDSHVDSLQRDVPNVATRVATAGASIPLIVSATW